LGFLHYDKSVMLESLPACLSLEWNTSLSEAITRQFLAVCALIPGSSAIADVIAAKASAGFDQSAATRRPEKK
jgi:hypothetical protein